MSEEERENNRGETYTCWGELLEEEARRVNDPLQLCNFNPERLEDEFDVTDPSRREDWFYVWGKDYVYFPSWKDGKNIVGKAIRNPVPGTPYNYPRNIRREKKR